MTSGELLDRIEQLLDDSKTSEPYVGYPIIVDKIFKLIREWYEEEVSPAVQSGREEPRAIYTKVGNDFVKLGYEFTGWPKDGVWVVSKNGRSSTCVIDYLGVPDHSLIIGGLAQYNMAASKVLMDFLGTGMPIYEIVMKIFSAVTDAHYNRCKEDIMETLENEVHEQSKHDQMIPPN